MARFCFDGEVGRGGVLMARWCLYGEVVLI